MDQDDSMLPRTHLLALAVALLCAGCTVSAPGIDAPSLRVPSVEDFEVDGTGSAAAWAKTEWTELNRRDGGDLSYRARFKVLYSTSGLYFLMTGSDELLTSAMAEDFMDLWKEDVYEVFLWTDERRPIYFEYEISPLNRELPILVPNFDGVFLGWRPWHYDGGRRTRKKTSVVGNRREPGAIVKGWTAEFFVPYELLRPLPNVPPKKGSRWRANFYRVDHDHGNRTAWDWARVGSRFHEYEKFGTLIFD